jgi:hypothetical protein
VEIKQISKNKENGGYELLRSLQRDGGYELLWLVYVHQWDLNFLFFTNAKRTARANVVDQVYNKQSN